MPCTKCEEGKYKWGETGECKYDTLDACESANHKYSKMKPTPLGKKSYEEYEKELKEYNFSTVYKVDLSSLKEVEKLMRNMGQKASIVESIFDALDGELLDRRNFREDAEEQLQNADDYKQNIEGSKEEVELAKSRLDKAKDELKDDQDGYKEEIDKYKKLQDKVKEQEKLVKARQKQYISESKTVGKELAKVKKAYADLQKAGKALGIAKIPVENYNNYVSDAEEWGTGKLPSGFDK
jgi:chromosome segregation ATPase